MSKTFLTQCPHCATRFRVNSQQLFVAQGAVRCGSCMQIFNARLFLEQDPDNLPAPAPATSPDPDHLNTLQIHDDMDIDLDSEDFEQELARLARLETENGASKPPLTIGAAAPFMAPKPEPQEPPLWPLETAPIDLNHDSPEEPPLFAELPASPDDEAELYATETPDWTATGNNRHEPSLASSELDAIASEPLCLEWQPDERKSGTLLWGVLSLLAALGLVIQYAYYDFEQLARQPLSRPWLEKACLVVGCKLLEQVDVSLIASSNLIVRPHADFANALSVDAIIYNRASFSQPFPLLQLNFTDNAQQRVASRTFSPAEYLGGELAGRNSMPAQVPIRIALDVLVPDARASGYNLKFLSPE